MMDNNLLSFSVHLYFCNVAKYFKIVLWRLLSCDIMNRQKRGTVMSEVIRCLPSHNLVKGAVSIFIILSIIIGITGFSINVNTCERQYEVSISSGDSIHNDFYLNPSSQMDSLCITEDTLSVFFPSEFPFTDAITLLHVSSFIEMPYKPPLVI